MREIPLSQGYVALVDDEDYEGVSRSKWHAMTTHGTVYAVRNSGDGHGMRKLILMHREILGTAPGMETDHINGDGLDNRRANLRECNHRENQHNRRSNLRASSGFKGVSWLKRDQKWVAQIKADGCQRHLGYFRIEAEAGEAYKAAAEIVHGEFAAGVRGDRL